MPLLVCRIGMSLVINSHNTRSGHYLNFARNKNPASRKQCHSLLHGIHVQLIDAAEGSGVVLEVGLEHYRVVMARVHVAILLYKLPPPCGLVLPSIAKAMYSVCIACRSNVERLQGQLQTSESSNSQLKERVDTMEEELREANLERDGLRSLNERSSAELRRALEVRMDVCTCISVCVR